MDPRDRQSGERGRPETHLDLWRAADRALDRLLDLPPDERQAALDTMELPEGVRARVERLLAEAEGDRDGILGGSADDLLQALDEETDPDRPHASAALIGRTVGPYRIEGELGRGGMSAVFRAHRADGKYEREVALKLVTLFDQAQGGGERMVQEARTLARLDHPGIATLLDAGIAKDGTPWLAMELVDGERIDRHCEERNCNAGDIVRLVIEVCDAVQFAHRRLIIHRDLKPGNVLVDREGRVRLLDFGIAKVLQAEGSEASAEATSTRILTPEYGAPEQLAGQAVTTATDVYGLGALLYRLLAGRPPFTSAADRPETPEPITRHDGQVRDVDAELALIVSVAMRPEPERRYSSMEALGDDLRRWLDRRPLAAAPDRWSYRLQKLLQRRRGPVLAAAAVLAALVLGLLGTVTQARRAAREAAAATAEAERATSVTRFLVDLFTFADPDRAQGEDLKARELLASGARQALATEGLQPATRAELLRTIGGIYTRLGLYEEAEPLLERALAQSGDRSAVEDYRTLLASARLAVARADFEQAERDLERAADLGSRPAPRHSLELEALEADRLHLLGVLRREQGRYDEAQETLRAASERRAAAGQELEVAEDILALAETSLQNGELDAAAELYEEATRTVEAEIDGDHTLLARILHARGLLMSELRRDEEAIDLLERALRMRERLLGEDHPDVAYTLQELSVVHSVSGGLDRAYALLERALELSEARVGRDHPVYYTTVNSLAILDYRRGDLETAIARLEPLVVRMAETLGPKHPERAEVMVNLGLMLNHVKQLDRARALLEEALEIHLELFGEHHPATAHNLAHVANNYLGSGDLVRAEEYARRMYAANEAVWGAKHPETLSAVSNLAVLYQKQGKLELAADHFRIAWEGMIESQGKEDPLTMLVQSRYAAALAAVGQGARALELARQSVAAQLSVYGDEHRWLWEARAAEIQALRALGREQEAASLAIPLLEVIDRVRPDWADRPLVAAAAAR